MLQTIRERAQGWIAWVIVILISIPFALWGINSYLGVGGETVVAVVDGVKITEREFDYRFRAFMARLQERLGAAYRPELFDDANMRSTVLDEMIREQLLLDAARDLGLSASARDVTSLILSEPAFQKNEVFDEETSERMLALQGITPSQYKQSLRQVIVRSQIERTLIASEVLLDKEFREAVRLDRQQRRLALVRVPKPTYWSDDPIPDEAVDAYYSANRARYEIPERIRVQYLVLDVDAIAPEEAAGEGLGEEDVRARYEAEIERFTEPERRRVRHLLIALDRETNQAAEDAVKARVLAIRERIAAGEDFAALARELSQDPGSAEGGGDLGRIERGLMDPAFDEAAFTLSVNQVSEPIRTRFGYHLIEVTDVEARRAEPFEEVKDQLIAEIQAETGGEGLYYDWAERLANLTYESPDTLAPAAEALGLELQTSEWMDRQSGGDGLLAHPGVLAAAFSDEVRLEGRNSDLIEPDPNRLQAIVLRVIDHQEASIEPLDEVRDDIVNLLLDQRAAGAAAAKAAALGDALRNGEVLDTVAGDFEIEELGLVSRDAGALPADVRDYAFALQGNPGGTSYGSLSVSNGDGMVVILREVVDGSLDELNEATRNQILASLSRTVGRAYYKAFVADLAHRTDIERRSAEQEGFEQ